MVAAVNLVVALLLNYPIHSYGFVQDNTQKWRSVASWASSGSADLLDRRDLLLGITAVSTLTLRPSTSLAEEAVATASVSMKDFVDPKGLFAIRIPQRYYALRRSAKGDLPDEKTGQGRRGSNIFTAGDMAKAEVVAVERFPVRVLLEENGIAATGSLATFPDIGDPTAVAKLINLRREKDKPSNTQLVAGSVVVSPDGKELQFKLRTEIEVQKPELLMEMYGVSALFRITSAKASLRANDGNLLAVFASALENDFNGPDGEALNEAVSSFTVVEQPLSQGTL